MQRRRAGRKRNGMLPANNGRDSLLNLVDIRANGRHPVRLDRFINPPLFVAMHRWA
jgi:hypothetical protein